MNKTEQLARILVAQNDLMLAIEATALEDLGMYDVMFDMIHNTLVADFGADIMAEALNNVLKRNV